MKCLGILPVFMFPHYDKAENIELKDIPDSLEKLLLPNYKFRVFYKAETEVGSFDNKLVEVLINLALELNSRNIKWLLGGSSALMVHGINICPNDIDILTSSENIELIEKIFKNQIIPSDKNLLLKIDTVRIEVIELNNFIPQEIIFFHNTPIPVNPLSEELHYYENRPGKENVVDLINKKLNTN